MTLNPSEERVLWILRSYPAATCRELANTLGLEPNQVSGRLTELKRKGFAVPAGKVAGDQGRLVIIWAATRHQREDLCSN